MSPLAVLAALILAPASEVSGQDYCRAGPDDIAGNHECARKGDVGAQAFLATAYFTGSGVPRDLLLAHMWANIAAAQSTGENPDRYRSDAARRSMADFAAALRDTLEAEMTRPEIRRATEMVHEFRLPDVRTGRCLKRS